MKAASRSDDDAHHANTSFLPAITPRPQRMTAVVRERTIDAETRLILSLAETAGLKNWRRKRNWLVDTVPFGSWEGLKALEVPSGVKDRPPMLRIDEMWLGNNNLDGCLPPSSFMW